MSGFRFPTLRVFTLLFMLVVSQPGGLSSCLGGLLEELPGIVALARESHLRGGRVDKSQSKRSGHLWVPEAGVLDPSPELRSEALLWV
jgi:hypothetical protein